jgi:ABC-type lipoprotein release transport system permease subunit
VIVIGVVVGVGVVVVIVLVVVGVVMVGVSGVCWRRPLSKQQPQQLQQQHQQ